MSFTIADLALMILGSIFILSGLYYGFIRTLGNLIGIIGGIVASIFALSWINSHWDLSEHSFWQIVIFLAILLFFSQLIGWLFELIDRAYKILSILPFLASINKLLGGILGFLEAFIVLSGVLYYANTELSEGVIKEAVLNSRVTGWLSFTGDWTVTILGWILGR